MRLPGRCLVALSSSCSIAYALTGFRAGILEDQLVLGPAFVRPLEDTGVACGGSLQGPIYLLQVASTARRAKDFTKEGGNSTVTAAEQFRKTWDGLNYSSSSDVSQLSATSDFQLPLMSLATGTREGTADLGPKKRRTSQETKLEDLAASAALVGQARGLVALLQGSAQVQTDSSGRSSTVANEAASTAALLMIAVLIVSLGLYAVAMAWDGGKRVDQRRLAKAGPPAASRSGRSTQSELAPNPQPAAESSLMRAWPPMTPQVTPPPSRPVLSSRQVPLRPERPSMPSQDAYEGVPAICPQLVMPTNYIRLAVPVDPLLDPHFELDVLGLSSGSPLLSAAAVSRNGRRSIEISLHSAGTLLAVVTPNLQLTRADGSLIGSLARPASHHPASHVLRNAGGRTVMLISSGRSTQEMKFVTPMDSGTSQGFGNDQASVSRRPAGHLPAEHYEVVVCPNVDAVLILACFLALVVFAPPSPSATPVAARWPESGRNTPAQIHGSAVSLPPQR
ncbi:unnamed protein product [Polarella glacialis]|uniref:Transmembrane protein n=1 Tax=Polarella glacialis TaxID=89957 RepID=A0A813FNI8_POLGL|nr:unnamed protein product [Polarella glacialis]